VNACPEWNDRLLNHAAGGPSGPETHALEGHLKRCPGCAGAVEKLLARATEIDLAVRQLVECAGPSAGFDARVLSSAQARPARTGRRLWQVGVVAAVVTAAIVFALVLNPRWSKPRPAVTPHATAPAAALSGWRSPTEGLLRSSGDELLRSGPRLGLFYLRMGSGQKSLPKKDGGNRDES